MSAISLFYNRFRWLHVPVALLLFLLQRAPMLRTVVTTEFVLTSTAGSVLKGVLLGSATLGAVQTVAGATELDAGDRGNPIQATVGQSFVGGFAVVGAPATAASYEVTGDLPPGLTITGINGDTVNGNAVSITGTPTVPGEFTLKVRAWRGINKTLNGGSPIFDYVINVAAAAGEAPTISAQPVSTTVAAGQSASFSVEASGDPAPTFQWRKDGADIPGATSATLLLASVQESDEGDYTVVVGNSAGEITSATATLTVNPAAGITISAAPVSVDVASGGTAAFSVAASSTQPMTFQWFHYRAGPGLRALAGETSTSLVIQPAVAEDMGFYFVRISNGGDTLDSSYAILTLTGGESRLANLSTRGSVPTGGTLTPGFVLRGTGSKQLVIRAVGPELADFGVATAMADPIMDIVPQGGAAAETTNDNWQDASNAAALAATSAVLGAFPLDAGSADAAVLTTVSLPNSQGNQAHTVQIRSVDGSSGIALAEVYDPDGEGAFARLSNISARGFSGLGAEVLAPGFVISGTGAKTMLIRVVGPTLANFGVPGTMADPRLEVIPGGQTFPIAANDNWGGTAELKAAFATTGAFNFSSDGSLDAAVLVRLPPGAYTVRPTGASDGTGEILVEAYEVLE